MKLPSIVAGINIRNYLFIKDSSPHRVLDSLLILNFSSCTNPYAFIKNYLAIPADILTKYKDRINLLSGRYSFITTLIYQIIFNLESSNSNQKSVMNNSSKVKEEERGKDEVALIEEIFLDSLNRTIHTCLANFKQESLRLSIEDFNVIASVLLKPNLEVKKKRKEKEFVEAEAEAEAETEAEDDEQTVKFELPLTQVTDGVFRLLRLKVVKTFFVDEIDFRVSLQVDEPIIMKLLGDWLNENILRILWNNFSDKFALFPESIRGFFVERLFIHYLKLLGNDNQMSVSDLPFFKNLNIPAWFYDFKLMVNELFAHNTAALDLSFIQNYKKHINCLLIPSNFAGPDGILFLNNGDKYLFILFGAKFSSNDTISDDEMKKNEFTTKFSNLFQNNKTNTIRRKFMQWNKNFNKDNIYFLSIRLEVGEQDSKSKTIFTKVTDKEFSIKLNRDAFVNMFNIKRTKDIYKKLKLLFNKDSPEESRLDGKEADQRKDELSSIDKETQNSNKRKRYDAA